MQKLLEKNLNNKLSVLFKSLKIKKNDKIVVHSNIAGLLQFTNINKENGCKIFINFLKKYIGEKGIIIVPTYNYQFTKHKNFNVKSSPSEVGFFSNYLLKKNWKKRTLDPVFSHMIFGKLTGYNNKKINTEAFGEDSIFSILKKKNFKIICFCCSTDRITFIHYIEYLLKVPYRYIKKFKGYVVNVKIKKLVNYKYNVGKKNFDYSFKEKSINKIIDKKNFINKNFGRFECYSVTCDYLYKKILKNIKKENKFLIT